MAKIEVVEREFGELALPNPIKRAVILHKGTLTPEYAHLSKYLD